MRDLAKLRDYKRRRCSSWDRTGGNKDYITIAEGETALVADIRGAGCITHLWCTIACEDRHYLRKMLLRMFWDGEGDPSVEVPIGDFFGMGHCATKNFVSLPITASPQDGRGFNCFFPMPYSESARIEVLNEGDAKAIYYFYVDYEEYEEPEGGLGRFHAMWRRESPCDGVPGSEINLTGEGNYVILEAEGKGHYVGCILNVHNLTGGWYGEGDDMIFIDGERLPSIHGTGTEDYFNMAWGPSQEYNSPYHGVIFAGGPDWSGKITLYRFHVEDPIYFEKSIRVTIEHGHANRRSDDYSSVAYWYQTEPHRRFPRMLPASQRLPRG